MRKRVRLIVLATLFVLSGAWALSRTVFAATTVTVDDAGDAGDADPGDGACATAAGACTLRAAIEELNALGVEADPHGIQFDIPGAGPHVITPLTELPWIQVPVVIDGETQPTAACPTASSPANLQVVLDGSNRPSDTGLWLHLGSDGSTLRGLVVGNFAKGIEVSSGDNHIECNHIGVDANGLTDMGNGDSGVTLSSGSNNNVIGGDSSHNQRNVISGNGGEGILLSDNDNTLVANNYIGTTADGLNPLGNSDGVFVIGADNIIGGTSSLAGNVISGNGNGVHLLLSENSRVWGNFIGIGADGVTPVANSDHGIFLGHTTAGNLIGGPTPAEQNVIAHNNQVGIYGQGGEQNSIRGNRIFANGALGIDLLTNGVRGVDLNDDGDVDDGPNQHQNYPVLATATDLAVSGTLDSTADQTYELDFYRNETCDLSGHGEGETYLGTTTVTTDGSGQASFTYGFSSSIMPGDSLTATATDSLGNTSEFSACMVAEATSPPTPTPTPTATVTPPPGGPTSRLYLPLVTEAFIPPPGVLADGGTVVGDSGAMIGVVRGALTAPVAVTITVVSPPPEPLAGVATPVGDYYFIGAEVGVYTPADKPFVIGLPVPAGVQPDELAVDALVAVEDVSDFEGTGKVWSSLPGIYDAANNLFVVTTATLDPAGMTLVLTEHPAHKPIETATWRPNHMANAPIFEVRCHRSSVGSPACDPTNFLLIETELTQAYTDFVTEFGLKEPALKTHSGKFQAGTVPRAELKELSAYGGIFVREAFDAECRSIFGNYAGSYNPVLRTLTLCIDPQQGINDAAVRTIRHEFFHAIQYAYGPVWRDTLLLKKVGWIIEGTATSAERSTPLGSFRSPDYYLRGITTTLLDGDSLFDSEDYEPYEAQDYWVYLGTAPYATLSYLNDVFEQGIAPAQVNKVLPFSDHYWAWVKNQVIEREFPLDGMDPTPCALDQDLADPLLNGTYDMPSPVLSQEIMVNQTLDRLTATVVEITLATIPSPGFEIKATADGDQLHYKVYIPGEAGCSALDDGEREFTQSLPAGINTLYVVLANTDHEGPLEFDLCLNGADDSPLCED